MSHPKSPKPESTPFLELVQEAEARLRAAGHWPPTGAGYDLNDPTLRAKLLDPEQSVDLPIAPPPAVADFLARHPEPLTQSEFEVLEDFIDHLFELAPDYTSLWEEDQRTFRVIDTHEAHVRKMHTSARYRASYRGDDLAGNPIRTADDLAAFKSTLKRAQP